MLGNIGVPGLILILIIALIIFGPKKLPEMGRAMGQTLKEFKKSTKELTSDFDDDDEKKPKASEKKPVVVKEEKSVAVQDEKAEVVEQEKEEK